MLVGVILVVLAALECLLECLRLLLGHLEGILKRLGGVLERLGLHGRCLPPPVLEGPTRTRPRS